MLRFLLLTLLLIYYLSAGTFVRHPATLSATSKPSVQEARQRTASAGTLRPFSARPFPYRRVAVPDPHTFTEVQCINLNSHWSICKHRSPDLFFALIKDKRIVGTWSAEIMVGGGSRFEAVMVDLDGDHKDELVVANCTGINTAGHALWRLSIFPNFAERGFTKPLQFITEQYAAQGTFLQTPGDPLCNLLITE